MLLRIIYLLPLTTGSYAFLSGRDASRRLAGKDELELFNWDELQDLNEEEMGSLTKWSEFFAKKYPCVGRLVRSKGS